MPNTARDGERINLPNGCYWLADKRNKKHGVVYDAMGNEITACLNVNGAISLAAAMSQPATSEPASVCSTCNGNDADMPCAYPSEGQKGCLRDQRLNPAAVSADAVEWQGNHEDMAFYAFRYALGRRTYAVSDIAKYLTDNWSRFNANHRRLIHQEISEALTNNMAGDECDKQQWRTVLALSPETVCGGE